MFVFGGGLCIVILLWMTERTFTANGFLPKTRSYCQHRTGAQRNECCSGRQDECSVPFLDTLCYCDEFCDRHETHDCCSDYWTFCRNEPPTPPPQHLIISCNYNGRFYQVDEVIKYNCNQCTCRRFSPTRADVVCEEHGCLIRPDVIQKINQGNFGWRASNYSFFWGKTLDDGYKHRLGACKPETPVIKQNGIHQVMNGEVLELEFDARRKWAGQIQPIRDQQDFPSSWAISTVDLAADRLAIQSHGLELMTLSAQHLISCVANRKNHCHSGSTDRAWWHLSTFGVVTEDCYPYTSDSTKEKGHCLVSRDQNAEKSNCPDSRRESMVYRTPPAYRVNENEKDIMMEIKTNGPVQAILRVKDDFFVYKSGVYRHTKVGNNRDIYHRHPFHAVRIIGWGVDRSEGSPINYWLCANSWGTQWGENGYFRIVRGENECDIEMFVVGVWAKRNNHNNLISNHINKK